MCRWMAWFGQPVLIEELVFKTQHGIVDQSMHARMGAEPTNGDGFGLGWYGGGEGPGLYHSVVAGVVRRQPARAGRPRRVAPVLRPRPRGDRLAGAADQLPPLPPRPLAVRAQRLCRRLPRRPARAHARHRPRPVRGPAWLDGHRDRLPPGPDLRAGATTRSARSSGPSASSRTRPRRRGVPPLVQGTFGTSDGERLWAVRYATEGTAAVAVRLRRRRRHPSPAP